MSNSEYSPISARPNSTKRLNILPLHHVQALDLLDYHYRNREFFKATAPTPSEDFYTEEYWQRKIWQSRQDWEKQKSALFVLRNRESQDENPTLIIGSVNFNQIIRGVLQSCFLGYSLDQHYQRRGLMTEALELLTDHIFSDWKLHRIQANYLETNLASAKVLEKLGFEKEGLAKKYLKINGSWQDHILTAKITPEPNP